MIVVSSWEEPTSSFSSFRDSESLGIEGLLPSIEFDLGSLRHDFSLSEHSGWEWTSWETEPEDTIRFKAHAWLWSLPLPWAKDCTCTWSSSMWVFLLMRDMSPKDKASARSVIGAMASISFNLLEWFCALITGHFRGATAPAVFLVDPLTGQTLS